MDGLQPWVRRGQNPIHDLLNCATLISSYVSSLLVTIVYTNLLRSMRALHSHALNCTQLEQVIAA